MELEQARHLIVSGNSRERLDAARELARHATPSDFEVIASALTNERATYVRATLMDAARRLRGPTEVVQSASDNQMALDDVYAVAMQDTTGMLIHEISPIVGALRTHAELEIGPERLADSQVLRALDRLDALLDALHALNEAATAPRLQEFDLAELVGRLTQDLAMGTASLELAGPDPFLVVGDASLISLVIRNGLSNAIDATIALPGDPGARPVVVRWDDTDADYWVVVLDRGIGLPPTHGSIFEIGVSGKRGHLGMGLSLAVRAALTLHGQVTLTPRSDGGTQFLFRWPKTPQEP